MSTTKRVAIKVVRASLPYTVTLNTLVFGFDGFTYYKSMYIRDRQHKLYEQQDTQNIRGELRIGNDDGVGFRSV